MFKNHLVVALRGLRRHRGHAALHVTGLAVGLACCFLVLLYVEDELSFDRFHANADRIFQLGEERMFNGNPMQITSASAVVAEALEAEVPAVEAVVQMQAEAGLVRRPAAREAFEEDAVLFASDRFFEVFSFPLLRGDPATVLGAPGAVVLSETAAAKYFGGGDPVGQTLLLERQAHGVPEPEPLALSITGVAADAPANSTLQFDLVVSGTTEVQGVPDREPKLAHGGRTFVMTRTPEDRAALEAALPALIEAHEDIGFGTFSKAFTNPLSSLHLTYQKGSGFAGHARYLYLFSAVALLILLIACINYTNLATAYAVRRAKEVGVRKTMGARRGELARQFLTETLLTTAAAGLLALAIVALALPAFNHLFDKAVAFEPLRDAPLLLAMLVTTGLVGLAAGAYPALYLSRFQPVTVLKGRTVHGRDGARLRRGLVVVQFAATVALLTATVVISEQLRYAQARDLGFDGDQVLALDLSATAVGSQRAAILQAMEALPGVRAAALSSAVPGAFNMLISASPADTPDDPADNLPVYFADAAPAFAAVYGLELAAGRFFAEGEEPAGIVLNEAAARAFGLMADDPAAAVGQKLILGGEVEVIGVLEDFHFGSLHQEIQPVAFQPLGKVSHGLTLSLKLDGADVASTLGAVERTWRRFAPHHPFAYRFVDDAFDALYRADRQLGQIFSAVAAVAALLACLGLFGLAAYAAERRTKEIGVRKVLGASASSLVRLLSTEFVVLVLIAFAVGAPVAYLLMDRWLDDFAYRIELGPAPFVLVGLVALAIALLTVSYHAVRAATTDPVKALRHE